MSVNPPDHRLTGCLALLQLQEEVRSVQSVEQLGFVMVNRTMTVMPFTTLVFWRGSPGDKGVIERISGVEHVDRDAPFVVWMRNLLSTLANDQEGMRTHLVEKKDLKPQDVEYWSEWSPPHALWLPIVDSRGTFWGALWLVREKPWRTAEMALGQSLGGVFGHACMALSASNTVGWIKFRRVKSLVFVGVVLSVLFGLWIPVTQSVLAPATVIARDPLVVTSPLNGAIESLEVTAHTPVLKGQLLFRMESTELRNQRDVAQTALHVVQESYLKAQKVSFSDPEAKATLPLIQAQIKQSSEEVLYAQERLLRSELYSERAGIAIFSNHQGEWQGKPVVVGERVMVIADPESVELEIFLPVEDAVIMQPGSEIKVFLNTDPFNPLDALLIHAAYEAEVTPEGVLAYRLTAHFKDKKISENKISGIKPRIGLKGMAKLMGQKVPLYYYLFRRPLTALRQMVGF